LLQDLIGFYEGRGVEVTVLSGYGITDVNRPIHLNRLFREQGLINVRLERGTELLDVGTSRALAMADHQIAHVYVKHQEDIPLVKSLLEATAGIEKVLDADGKREHGLDHDRAGELVALADDRSWFTYYYWLDDAKAPDFARTVDIHKKVGYDPVEMVLDPEMKLVLPRIGLKLLKKKLGFRTLMNVIPLDAKLIKGSHGRVPERDGHKPVFISGQTLPERIEATDVFRYLLDGIEG
ncbi:MAG: alkaline phosphatase family protein, partial [Bacteroidota bacterium]